MEVNEIQIEECKESRRKEGKKVVKKEGNCFQRSWTFNDHDN